MIFPFWGFINKGGKLIPLVILFSKPAIWILVTFLQLTLNII